MHTWDAFYDPVLYEMKIGPGGRVVDAYLDLVGSDPVTCLEIGCGTGGVAIPFAAAGHSVVGLDCSPAMLARAQAKTTDLPADQQRRLSWVAGDMLALNLDRTFDRVLLPNEVAAHVLEGSALVAFLRRCREHLVEGGTLILDVARVSVRLIADAAAYSGVHLVHGAFPMGEDGRSVCVSELVVFDTATWRVTKTFEYKYLAPDGTVERTTFRRLVQRCWTVQELTFALELAGFGGAHVPRNAGDEERVFVVAANPGGRKASLEP